MTEGGVDESAVSDERGTDGGVSRMHCEPHDLEQMFNFLNWNDTCQNMFF